MEALKLVSVSFHCAGKIFDFDAGDLELVPGDKVIVETERGRALGTIVSGPRPTAAEEAPPKLKTVLRIATPSDYDMAAKNTEREKEAITFCRERIRQRGLDMKLVRAEYLFDGSKVLFYFTADGRIDFRDLVRDLAQHLRTRIEMRQIGVRDEAKLVGGLGVCGRELCCSSYLREFAPVSVKMAKAQGLALNPSKISGQCGRLLCCLAYEYENYNEMRKTLPKIGKKLNLPGGTAEVISLDILKQSVTLSCPGGERCRMEIAALQKEIAAAQQAVDAPPAAESPQPRKKPAATAPSATAKGTPGPGKNPAQRRSKTPAPPAGTPPPAEEQKPATDEKTPRRRRRPRRRSNKPKNPGPEST
jgi:cell fate regulator YaaT (PSP1 superfamily)